MNNKFYQIFYFSGTGNTLLLVDKIAEVLSEEKREYKAMRIETNPEVDKNQPIILAFPIACFTTYPFVWSFIKNLPIADGTTKVSVMYSMGGRAFKFHKVLFNVLKKRGYLPQTLSEIVMPSNFTKQLMETEELECVIHKGKEEADKFTHEVIEDVNNWKKSPIVFGMYNSFIQSRKWYKLIPGLKLHVVTHKCTKCGLCAQLCPTGNINMKEYPLFDTKCVICLRCFGNCPTAAITLGKSDFKPYTAVEPNELIR